MKKPNYLAFLKAARARAELLLPPATAERVLQGDPVMNAHFGGNTGLDAMITSLAEDAEDKNSKDYAALVKQSHDGDVTAKAEVAQIRLLRTNNFLLANSNWLSFFTNVDLPQGVSPGWLNTSRHEVRASEMGADGRPRLSQILPNQTRTKTAEWKKISTETFEYPLVDPLRPGVAEESKSLIDLAGAMDEDISILAKPFVTGACVANFTNTGKRGAQTRTYVLSRAIDPSNIPDGNQINASAGGRFGKGALDKIIEYCSSWGKLFDKRPLRPQFILIPSKDYNGILADITLTSQANPLVEEIMSTGLLMNYAGYKFTLIPDETLSSTDGFAYVKFDREFGEFYTMSSLDEMNDIITTESKRNNKGLLDMAKWISFIQPLPWSPMVARIKYK